MQITSLAVTTPDGESIQAELGTPEVPDSLVVVCHPHPLYGGDMYNPVPATLFRQLPDAGHAVARFNFRGVGASTGTHGQGPAEITDLEAVIDAALAVVSAPLTLVGYSFGADIVLACEHRAITQRVVIAPPLAVFSSFAAADGTTPTTALIPELDQMVDSAATAAIIEAWGRSRTSVLAGADHFVAGAIDQIVDEVNEALRPAAP